MRIKGILVTLIVIFLGTTVLAQENEKKCFLWEVKSSKTTAYVLGSIHLGKPSMYPLDQPIEEAFDRSDILVVEVNLNQIDQEELQLKFLQRGIFQNGDRLVNYLSAETLQKLSSRLKEYDLRLRQFLSYKPWFVGLTLISLQIQRLGFDEEYGIDHYFLKKAADKKEIMELESIDSQINLLDELPNQNLFLEYSLISLEEIEAFFEPLLKAWEQGDTQFLKKIFISDIAQQKPEIQEVYQKILFERNHAMTDKISSLLKTDKVYFIVVGSAHLVGAEGIIELLRKGGYRVQQL